MHAAIRVFDVGCHADHAQIEPDGWSVGEQHANHSLLQQQGVEVDSL